jgi:glycosyltransferase involved in cell wall biosynthesis
MGSKKTRMHPEVDLVLVSHNSQKDLDILLPSIKKYTEGYTLLIIDNGDQPITYDHIKVQNRGYGSACNAGASYVSSEFIVFMNCDLEVSEGWLDDLLKPFNDEKVVITGSRLFTPDGQEYPTPEKDNAIGCVFAVRRKFFDKIKGFDENYFLFFEETDMCCQAVNAGYKVIRSEARVVHFHPHFLPAIKANPFLKKCWDESKQYFEDKFNNLKRCLIGIPCGSGMMSAYVVDGLFKLNRPCPTSLLIIERQSVDNARNYIIEMAIKLNVDYLFFADDDGVF